MKKQIMGTNRRRILTLDEVMKTSEDIRLEIDKAEEEAYKEAERLKPKTPKLPETPDTNQNLNGFIYIPTIKLYIAKERSLNGLTWDNAIKEIYENGVEVKKQRAEMPTPFEFMSSLIYVLDNNIPDLNEDERNKFLDDILKTGSYRGNWLNAKFGKNTIETANLENGKLTWQTIPLESYLTEYFCANIRKINSQGLFTEKSNPSYVEGQTAYFWEPVSGCVARFGAGSDGAGLYCSGYAVDSDPLLGVRLIVRPKTKTSN